MGDTQEVDKKEAGTGSADTGSADSRSAEEDVTTINVTDENKDSTGVESDSKLNAGSAEIKDPDINKTDSTDATGDAGDVHSSENELQNKLEKANLLLEEARSKVDENWDQCLRLTAELENVRQRHERELEKAHKFALDNFSLELLPVIDSLELGLTAANEANADKAKLLTEGSTLTLKLLKTTLKKFGIKEVNPISEAFDPEFHQAMAMTESDKVSPNTIINVYQKGYLLNDRVIRPAMVVVAKAMQADVANIEKENDKKSATTKSEEKAKKSKKGSSTDEVKGSQIDEQA